MKRRTFLQTSAAGLTGVLTGVAGLLAWTPRAHAATITKTYYITDGYITQSDGVNVYFKGFSNGSTGLNVPATSFIVQEGDTVQVTINNTLGTSHSFVIDGVVDSGVIAGGTSKTVTFLASTAGSYLFYDKQNAPYNRVTGLHGAMAVMPAGSSNTLYAGSPTFVKQLFWIYNECDPAVNEAVRTNSTPPALSSYVPRYFTINGLSARPPGAPGYADPTLNSYYDPRTALAGYIGDRTLLRVLSAGLCTHSMHVHANHVEVLKRNGAILTDIWSKDVIPLDNNMGSVDIIYPFDPPPDAWPPVTKGNYVMHLHNEQTQTAGGGSYQFGAQTSIKFK